ncbi:MAG: ubiquinone/menaquinone biosynthesis methyltransferase [Verrucomicrobiota bacterium]
MAQSTQDPVQDQNPAYVHQAFSSIAKRYVVANHVLSLGVDLWWRKRVARLVSEVGPAIVLDVATGSGDLAEVVANEVAEARIIGVDFCAPMLAEARKRSLPDLLVCDGLALPFESGTVDAVTIGYGLRNMANWANAVAEFSRVLRPGGRLVVLDFSLPTIPGIRQLYRFYLHRVLPVIAGWMTGHRDAYQYLGESIERFPKGEEMNRLIESNGFREARHRPLLGGISAVYWAER